MFLYCIKGKQTNKQKKTRQTNKQINKKHAQNNNNNNNKQTNKKQENIRVSCVLAKEANWSGSALFAI